MSKAPLSPKYAMYVSSVVGKTFIRPGTNQILGGRRRAGGPCEWQPDKVVPITEGELAKYRKEYDRALEREHSLKRRTEAEWKAQQAAEDKAAAAAREAGEKAQKAAAQRMLDAESVSPPVAIDTP